MSTPISLVINIPGTGPEAKNLEKAHLHIAMAVSTRVIGLTTMPKAKANSSTITETGIFYFKKKFL